MSADRAAAAETFAARAQTRCRSARGAERDSLHGAQRGGVEADAPIMCQVSAEIASKQPDMMVVDGQNRPWRSAASASSSSAMNDLRIAMLLPSLIPTSLRHIIDFSSVHHDARQRAQTDGCRYSKDCEPICELRCPGLWISTCDEPPRTVWHRGDRRSDGSAPILGT